MKKLSPLTSHPLSCISCTHKIVTFSYAHSFLVVCWVTSCACCCHRTTRMRKFMTASQVTREWRVKALFCKATRNFWLIHAQGRGVRKSWSWWGDCRELHSYATFWAIRSFPSRYVKYVISSLLWSGKSWRPGNEATGTQRIALFPDPDRPAPTPSYKNWMVGSPGNKTILVYLCCSVNSWYTLFSLMAGVLHIKLKLL